MTLLRFSADGRRVATVDTEGVATIWNGSTANSDGLLRIWEVRSGTVIEQRGGLASVTSNLQFSPDGRTVAAMDTDDGPVRLWDLSDG